MPFFSKYKLHFVLSLILVAIYFALRFYKIADLPLFTDEAIYIRWAQIALQDSSWRFIALTDGKAPLFIWAVMFMLNFVSDPIVAGRLVSVVSGFGTLIGIWFLSYELFKKRRIAYIASILYIAFPFGQVHDRLALYDSLAAALFIWSLYFSVLLVRYVRLDIAYTLGILIGAGVLNKATNFYNLYLLPFTLLLFNWNTKKQTTHFWRWGVLVLFVVFISVVMYSILRLSPLYSQIDVKTATFVISPTVELQKLKVLYDQGNYEAIGNWFSDSMYRFGWNVHGLTEWVVSYLTPLYTLLVVMSLVYIKKYFRQKLLLVIYFLLPFLSLAFFGIVLFPRFIFFMSIVLLPLAAWMLDYIVVSITPRLNKNKIPVDNVFALLLLIVISYPLYVSFQYAIDPIHAPITKADSNQYVNNWTAGWGLKESLEFLEKEASDKKIYVATQGTFGLLPYGLEMYLVDNKNITIKGFWPIGNLLPEEVLQAAAQMPTYIIFYQPPQEHIESYPIELVIEKQAGKSDHFFRLYKVTSR